MLKDYSNIQISNISKQKAEMAKQQIESKIINPEKYFKYDKDQKENQESWKVFNHKLENF